MKAYLDILQDILDNCEIKENRTGIDTLVIPPTMFRHDMRKGFPLVTTKKVSLKTIAVELEFFIKGLTDKQWLKDRGCNIWNSWANPQAVESERMLREKGILPGTQDIKEIQKEENDLGPVYGYQWRNFNKDYSRYNTREGSDENTESDGVDQLANAMEKLKTNPDDRRMIVSAWNPNQLDQMALPACHLMFILQHINGKLSLNWTQRSCDVFLGVPYNIASYGFLLELICKEVGMIPHMLTGNLVDTHIYVNHIDQCKTQLSRIPKELPNLVLPMVPSIFDWEHDQYELEGYFPHDKISAKVAV